MSSIVIKHQSYVSTPEIPSTAEPPAKENSTYREILKSSALVGGSSVLNVFIGVIRTKAMAILLGPSGVGLMGLYSSILDLTQGVAGMGVNCSGVRQIAEAVATNDLGRIARTVAVLRRTSILLGALGTILLIVFSKQAAALTFGDAGCSAAVAVLAVGILFRVVSSGQSALIQGMRRIGDLAKISILGALAGTVISIPLVYFLRENGIIPSLLAVAAMTIGSSWWYSRKIQLPRPSMTRPEMAGEGAALLKLGFAFMASSLMTMGVAYVMRVLLLHKFGVAATGLYQSAWALGGLYVGFILQAMGADFFPRLTAAAHDNAACNRMVNEQARVGLLLAGPGVIGTLTFAPLVIALFYSARFGAAVDVLRWICLGAAMQVITWPIGFIILAKGRQGVFLLCELAWTIVNLAAAWLSVTYFGLTGAGVAFFLSYVFHGLMIYPIVSRLSGFAWSAENKRTGLFFLGAITLVFFAVTMLPLAAAVSIGTAALAVTGVYSLRVLVSLTSFETLPPVFRRMLSPFRASRANPPQFR